MEFCPNGLPEKKEFLIDMSSISSLISQAITRGERTKAEDDGEASDGNEQEPGKITASRGRREQAVPPALV